MPYSVISSCDKRKRSNDNVIKIKRENCVRFFPENLKTVEYPFVLIRRA